LEILFSFLMRITIDTEKRTLSLDRGQEKEQLPLYSSRAFEVISDLWVKLGWDRKYSYTFTWLGRPIVQLPEDVLRIQELIWKVRPDVIVETGVAHGGSLMLYASVCKALGKGRVIGVDIEIRQHNRKAIEEHVLSPLIRLIEGSSTAQGTVREVQGLIGEDQTVLVILDSCHTREHVLNELESYAPLVSTGSYIIATDGIMKELWDQPRGNPEWAWDNPVNAAEEFVSRHPEFVIEQPEWLFNESNLASNITYWPSAFLRRKGQ
jgi:cephalosporin hydroxylase